MKSLAKGLNSDAIFKPIKVLISTQQEDFRLAIQGYTSQIEDIADKIETNKSLFAEDEMKNGTILNESVLRDSPKKGSPDK